MKMLQFCADYVLAAFTHMIVLHNPKACIRHAYVFWLLACNVLDVFGAVLE